MKQTINHMVFIWVVCVGIVMLLFGYRLWFVPTASIMPDWATSMLAMAGILGSLAFAIMILAWLKSLMKKDYIGYKPVYGLKTGQLLKLGLALLLFTFTEIEWQSKRLNTIEASRTKTEYSKPLTGASLSKSTPLPTPAPTIKPISQKTVTQVDCVGPDKVVFKTTKEECTKFNQDWGVTYAPIYSPPPSIKVVTPTYPCILSFGTYNLTPTDCAKFKQQDQSLQDWSSSLQSLQEYQGSSSNTNQGGSNTSSSYVYIDYSQQNTACKTDVQAWLSEEIRSIEAIGRVNGSGSDVAYKTAQAQSKANSAIAECDQLYPVP